MKNPLASILAMFLLCVITDASAQNIQYVKQNGDGTEDGSSWANATSSFQAAINAPDVEQVWVAQGTYQAIANGSFIMKNNVAIYGGFNDTGDPDLLDRDWLTFPTILEGNGARVMSNNFSGSTPLLASAVLDGFTISGGVTTGYGGGIYNNYATPTLSNLIITGNTALSGGGMYNSTSSPSLTSVTLSNNSANSGGGMYNYSSSPSLTNVSLSVNSAGNGGGMFNAESSLPSLTNVNLSDNLATATGGGMYNTSSSPSLTNVILNSNSAITSGGGMYNYSSFPSLVNVLINGNAAPLGGGVYNSAGSCSFVNCTITGNGSNEIYADGATLGKNTIVWGEIDGAGFFLQNCLIKGNSNTSNGNLDVTGLTDSDIFTDAAIGDFSLKATSPAIDAGSNADYTGAGGDLEDDLDLAGNSRLDGETIDLGSFEYQAPPIVPTTANIIYVNKNVSGGDQSGDSWSNALPELAAALKYAKVNQAMWSSNIDSLQIFVSVGTYKPFYSPADDNFGNYGGRYNSFLMVNNVQLYGGFDPDSDIVDLNDARILPESESAGTVLSGDINGDDIITGSGVSLSITNNDENNFHVVLSSAAVGTARLDGFTISGGKADGAGNISINGNNIFRGAGGGIFNRSSSPTLTNVTLSGNEASYGGGMYNNSSSSPTLTNMTLSGNSATNYGGGMYNVSSSPTLADVTLSGNSAGNGGGMYNNVSSSPSLTDVNLSENSATTSGGGMYNIDSSSPSLANVTLTANISSDFGGGIYNNSSSPSLIEVSLSDNSANYGGGMCNYNSSFPSLINVTLDENIAGISGGGMYNSSCSPSLTNVILRGNSAPIAGGGMYNINASPILVNVIISGNTAPSGGGIYNLSGSGSFVNCTISGNGPFEIFAHGITQWKNTIVWGGIDGASYVAQFCLIKGNSNTSNGNINTSGLDSSDVFADAANGDYSLQATSPAINVGSNAAYTAAGGDLQNDLDLAGYPRLYDGFPTTNMVDLGAYEFQGDPGIPIFPSSANVIYVNKNISGGDGSGDSWANAVTELADALRYAKVNQATWSANIDSLQIFVATGTYIPLYSPADDNFGNAAGRDNSFRLVNNVQLYGGFDPANGIVSLSDARIFPETGVDEGGTILSGDINGDDVITGTGANLSIANNDENNFHVVLSFAAVGTARLDGFTITGGRADGVGYVILNGNNIYRGAGGGMFNHSSSPTLTKLTLTGNVGNYGGGMYNLSFSSPTLTNMILSGNSATNYGGGMYNVSSAPTLTDLTLSGNIAGNGGGMYNNVSSSPSMNNVLLSRNTASTNGGGVYNDSGSGSFVNCTVTGNSPNQFYASGSMSWKNTIVWGAIVGSGYTAQNCLIKGNINTYNGNINATGIYSVDVFADAANGDYSLQAFSPAINAGSNQVYTDDGGDLQNDVDLAGNPRVFNYANSGIIDMGAYEFQGVPVAPACIKPQVVAAVVNLIDSSVDISWITTASQSDVYLVNAGNPAPDGSSTPTYSGVNSPLHLDNLTAVDYEVYVRADCGGQDGVSLWVGARAFSIIVCEPSFPNGVEPITLVDLQDGDGNTIIHNQSTNTGGNPSPTAYEDFTAISGQLTTGEIYNMIIEGNTEGSLTTPISVYIDWNQNGQFAVNPDDGEVYNLSDLVNSTGADGIQSTGQIAVPVSAIPGTTRMRVMKKFGTTANPCNYQGWGQAEDYIIHVMSAICPDPAIAPIANQEGCDDFPLPTIEGTDLSGDEKYYTAPNGSGTAYDADEVLSYADFTSYPVTLYAYGTSTAGCTSEQSFTLTINQNDIAGVTFDNQTVTYDGNIHSLGVAGLPSDASVSYSANNAQANAGSYPVTATISSAQASCPDIVLNATLTINKAQTVITAVSPQTFTYDGTQKNVTASLNNNEGTLSYSPQQGYTDVGTYPIIVFSASTTNYLAASANVSLVINVQSQTSFIAVNISGTALCGLRNITISIYNSDYPELNDVFTTTLTGNGDFTTPEFPAGTYSILIKVDGYLAKLYPDEIIENGSNQLAISGLIAGDVNNSNSINISDISFITPAFGSAIGDANYKFLADLNCDGVVNISDISLLIISYGLQGDNPPINE